MSHLSRLRSIFSCLIMAIAMIGCNSTHLWDELPQPVAEFVSKYFPEQGVSSYIQTSDSFRVKLNAGASITFDGDMRWTSINGYGSCLPQMFLFDQLPPALYEYIQGLGDVDAVYAAKRDAKAYYVTLPDSTITYDIASGKISTAY